MGCQRLGLILGRGAILLLKIAVIVLVVGSMCLTVTSAGIVIVTLLALVLRTWL